MKPLIFVLSLILPSFVLAQTTISIDSIQAPSAYDNISIQAIASDSLSSSFLLFIKEGVKKHKHAFHSEHIYVLEGEGEMILGNKVIMIKKGDVIFVPQNTTHSLKVISDNPIKVLSVQSPFFDGKDRIFVEE